ncbi:MAG: peroxiredoxin family protein [Maioricimonas sp. JB049]
MKFPIQRMVILPPRQVDLSHLHPRVHRLALLVLTLCCVPASGLAADPELSVTDWAGVQAQVRAASGKVVVVQIWTMTCPGCREEFPEITRQLATLPQDQVEWIAVNCDYDGIAGKPPEWYQPRILEFLRKHPGRLVHLQLDVPLLDFLEQQRLETTPAFYVYRRDGSLAHRFPKGNGDDSEVRDVLRSVQSLARQG